MIVKLKHHGSVLPEMVKTKNGVCFDPRPDIWKYKDALIYIKIDFNLFMVEDNLKNSLKLIFIWYSENNSPFYVSNIAYYFRLFFDYIYNNIKEDIAIIYAYMLKNYKTSLSERDAYMLKYVAYPILKLCSMDLFGVTEDAKTYLNHIKIKGNIKGEAVLTMDPIRGPLTDIEFNAINTALYRHYEEGVIKLPNFLLAWLFMSMGHRPVQYAAMKVCDFFHSESSQGYLTYILKVPRAKQRGCTARSLYKERVLIPKVGEMFALHVSSVKERFFEVLADVENAPMFPSSKGNISDPTGYEWHMTSSQLSDSAIKTISKLGITSERTGETLRISPQRFRYSVGTRAAIEGHGELVIAELLDHSDTQNVGVYVKAVPELIEKFTAKLALQLAPLASAFKGRIIDPKAEPNKPENTFLRIFAPEHTENMRPTGSCGEHSLCGLMEPLACYTCQSFQPWLDGPHATILKSLIEERERIQKSATDGNTRIASINDLTILAVAEVVSQCEKIRVARDKP